MTRRTQPLWIYLVVIQGLWGCEWGSVLLAGGDAFETGRPDAGSDLEPQDSDLSSPDVREAEDGAETGDAETVGGDPFDGVEAADAQGEEPAAGGCVGDPCSSASQCGCVPGSGRECLLDVGGYIYFRGGYCSASCSSSAECSEGAACVEITTGESWCLKLCSSSSQCRMVEGYSCTIIPVNSDTRTYCLPIGCCPSDSYGA
jgi:hypothetical protein